MVIVDGDDVTTNSIVVRVGFRRGGHVGIAIIDIVIVVGRRFM